MREGDETETKLFPLNPQNQPRQVSKEVEMGLNLDGFWTEQGEVNLKDHARLDLWFTDQKNHAYEVNSGGNVLPMAWVVLVAATYRPEKGVYEVRIAVHPNAAATICKEKYAELKEILGFRGPAPKTEFRRFSMKDLKTALT